MENQNQLFKLLVLVVVLFCLLYVAVMLSNQSKERNNNSPDQAKAELPVKTNALPEDKLPDSFPTDFPVEEGAVVKENSISKSDTGATQSTREFVSKKTTTENINLYTSYLRNSDWEIVNQANESNYKLVRAKKGYQTIQISVKEDGLTGESIVTVSLTEN